MDNQTAAAEAFVERRRTERRAGTAGLDSDPLVIAVRQQWQDAEDVMRRIRERRAAEAEQVK